MLNVLHRKRMRTSGFLVGDVMLLTMAFKKVKRNGGKPAVQNLVYVCNINFMFMLCLCLVYEATSCVKKQKSFCACVYDVRIVQYDWSNNILQALFKTMDHRSRLPNKEVTFTRLPFCRVKSTFGWQFFFVSKQTSFLLGMLGFAPQYKV